MARRINLQAAPLPRTRDRKLAPNEPREYEKLKPGAALFIRSGWGQFRAMKTGDGKIVVVMNEDESRTFASGTDAAAWIASKQKSISAQAKAAPPPPAVSEAAPSELHQGDE